VRPRAVLDAVEKRKILDPARNKILAIQPIAHCYTNLLYNQTPQIQWLWIVSRV
jgi:hypothetical protein